MPSKFYTIVNALFKKFRYLNNINFKKKNNINNWILIEFNAYEIYLIKTNKNNKKIKYNKKIKIKNANNAINFDFAIKNFVLKNCRLIIKEIKEKI